MSKSNSFHNYQFWCKLVFENLRHAVLVLNTFCEILLNASYPYLCVNKQPRHSRLHSNGPQNERVSGITALL